MKPIINYFFLNAICIFSLSISFVAFSQPKNLYLGFESSPSLAYMSYNKSTLKSTPLFGYSYGIIFKYNTPNMDYGIANIKRNLAFRTGLSFERKGYAITRYIANDSIGNPIGDEARVKQNFYYITAPLLLQFEIKLSERFHYFSNIGSYFSYLVLKNQVYRDIDNSRRVIINTPKTFDFGVIISLGFEYALKEKLLLCIEIRENLDVVNAEKSVKLSSTNLLIGLIYQINKNK